jgi:hypothetical protein
MEVSPQIDVVAGVPLKVTVLVPWVTPKPVPVIVTELPTGPDVGETLVMRGGESTVNSTPLLVPPLTFTVTFPVVAPAGTGTTMCVPLQLAGVAGVPLNVTVLSPWLLPKAVPAIVRDVPTAPEVGDKPVI